MEVREAPASGRYPLPVAPILRGTLLDGSAAPPEGERHDRIAELGGTVVEQIVSSQRTPPQDYLQDHDEWVVLLEGAATVDIDGESVELREHDWVLLPARVPHRLVRTEQGTVWLAVHAAPSP
jgi:cupin 2 domain-containing protein